MRRRNWLAPAVLMVGLLSPAAARAGWLTEKLFCKGATCPAPSYSCLNYWAPGVKRAEAHFHGPYLNVYPPSCAAETVRLNYRCPAVDPAHLVAERAVLP